MSWDGKQEVSKVNPLNDFPVGGPDQRQQSIQHFMFEKQVHLTNMGRFLEFNRLNPTDERLGRLVQGGSYPHPNSPQDYNSMVFSSLLSDASAETYHGRPNYDADSDKSMSDFHASTETDDETVRGRIDSHWGSTLKWMRIRTANDRNLNAIPTNLSSQVPLDIVNRISAMAASSGDYPDLPIVIPDV